MKPIINYHECGEFINLSVRKPSLRYLNEFVRLKCSPDLLKLNLFPNAKEITESIGAYNAVRENLTDIFPLNDSTVKCIMVGDGVTPRTGAMFAFRSNWEIFSIDPNMYRTKMEEGCVTEVNDVDRLTVIRSKIEDLDYFDFKTEFISHTDKILIVCVHSHAKLSECCKKFPIESKYIVNIPCCFPSDLPIDPDIEYTDWGIHSEKRQVEIYKGVR